MKLYLRAFLASFILAATVFTGRAEIADMAALVAERDRLTQERQQIYAKITANNTQHAATEAEYKRLNESSRHLDAAGEALRNRYDQLKRICPEVVPRERLDWCNNSQWGPHNERAGAHKKAVSQWNVERDAAVKREEARAAQARHLSTRSEQIAQRLAVLEPAIQRAAQVPAASSTGSSGSGSDSCSDITGTKDGGEGPTNCKSSGDAALATAKTLRAQNPVAAREHYQRAADSYRRSGDTTLANAILAEIAAMSSNLPGQPAFASETPQQTSNPATSPTVYVRPPAMTAFDLELQRQMREAQVENPTECKKSVEATIRDIDAKVAQLRREEPNWEPEPQVEVGTCTSRLHKVFGRGFNLSDTAIAKQVENREARGCLELKKAYLQRACECTRKGIALSTDEAIQDQTLEAFSAVRDLETRARTRGIPNERIRAIVTRAAEVRDCYNIQTIETLRSAEHALERELGLPLGPGSPPASQPLNIPQ